MAAVGAAVITTSTGPAARVAIGVAVAGVAKAVDAAVAAEMTDWVAAISYASGA
jgi:hypothetical protein